MGERSYVTNFHIVLGGPIIHNCLSSSARKTIGPNLILRVPTGDENREKGLEFDNKTQGP